MLSQINSKSGKPVYLQVVDQIKALKWVRPDVYDGAKQQDHEGSASAVLAVVRGDACGFVTPVWRSLLFW